MGHILILELGIDYSISPHLIAGNFCLLFCHCRSKKQVAMCWFVLIGMRGVVGLGSSVMCVVNLPFPSSVPGELVLLQ